MKVSELKPRQQVPELELEIVSKGDVREFATEKATGKVCNAAAKDDSGEVSLTLWNEDCDNIQEGDKVRIENGWCKDYQGQKQVSAGKFGKLEKVE